MTNYDVVRAALQARLEQLTRRVGVISTDLRRTANPDWEEQALERENDQVLEQLDVSSRSEAKAIIAALRRIQDGTYGTCVKCGASIGEARLAAVATSATCVRCAG